MAKNKTAYSTAPVGSFLETLTDEQKRADSEALIDLMEAATGERAQLFGTNIIGFGKYAYTYASGHAGEAPLAAFSPRKNAFSLYVYTGREEHRYLLSNLGKFKMGKACIYVKQLSDIHIDSLETLIQETIKFLSSTYIRVKSEK
ncbi:DUF1801 domain-containing protein [Sphingobacterium paludis]|jgi:hypothetical protein|uniref:Uncharacterized protein DUF1801 n=1 Tax=Sphingobacterium paludis TaxID=1476465 RepID=A0A4R7CU18_9SPHI|nr:DUF1801 domain-containing protein [Sphingobacterium paludis]TDS11923.1 uncharacterized protein DUF1801 [Sphingobacterium paludis]